MTNDLVIVILASVFVLVFIAAISGDWPSKWIAK